MYGLLSRVRLLQRQLLVTQVCPFRSWFLITKQSKLQIYLKTYQRGYKRASLFRTPPLKLVDFPLRKLLLLFRLSRLNLNSKETSQ